MLFLKLRGDYMKKKKNLIIIFLVIIISFAIIILILNKNNTVSKENYEYNLSRNEAINILEENILNSNIVESVNETNIEEKVEVIEQDKSNKTNGQINKKDKNLSNSNKSNTTSNAEDKNKENTYNNKTTSESKLNEIKSSEIKTENKVENNNDEEKNEQEEIKNTEPVRCTNINNHGMDVGNSKLWFNTLEEADAYYNEKIASIGKDFENGIIDNDTYQKTCPKGYEAWTCMYCNKWTINFYYRK